MEGSLVNQVISRLRLKTFKLQEIYDIPNTYHDINEITINSEPLLIYALTNMPTKTKLFHALLQCGCDMFALNDDGVSAYYLTHIDESSDVPDDTRDIFKLYYPGIWAAVDHGSIEMVRKSINLWCRTDIERNGQSLTQLAEMKKNKPIITLLNSISKSIVLAHAVLSNKEERLSAVVDTAVPNATVQQGGVNVNIQNLGALGATPLYFAMQNNNEELVRRLLELGADPAKVLTLENEVEIPMIFLSLRENVSFEIYRAILVQAAAIMDLSLLRYRSCTMLHCAVDNDVSVEKIDFLLEIADAKLIAARSNKNLCAVDVTRNATIKDRIRKKIEDNFHSLEFTLDLICYGYSDFILLLTQTEISYHLPNQDILQKYLHHVKQFTKNVGDCNIVGIQKYLVFNGPRDYHPNSSASTAATGSGINHLFLGRRFLINSLASGDGQPMLHKVVLRADVKVTQLLCSIIVGTLRRRIDETVDQFGRTALCYAYIMNSTQINEILVLFGASDFTIDYENRSPLAFKDKQDHPLRDQFLQYHCSAAAAGGADEDEPQLWERVSQRSYMLTSATACGPQHRRGDCSECLANQNGLCAAAAGTMSQRPVDIEDEDDDEDDDDEDADDEPAGVCSLS